MCLALLAPAHAAVPPAWWDEPWPRSPLLRPGAPVLPAHTGLGADGVRPGGAHPASGEGFDLMFAEPSPALPRLLEFDGETPVSDRFDGVTVTLDSDPAPRGLRAPTLTGWSGERVLFATRFDDVPAVAPRSAARIIRLDPATPAPQVVFSTYTGGAHCCTATRIVTQDPAGAWQVLDGGLIDGAGYLPEDVDADGHVELVGVDNGFLYAFAAYADSYAPPVVLRVAGGRLLDVTRAPTIRPFLRRTLRAMERAAAEAPALWASKGFVAGWAAVKSLVGEVEDAWPRVLAVPDEPGPCAEPGSLTACPGSRFRPIPFAEALRQHLVAGGYAVPARAGDGEPPATRGE